jgi:hypothetical protein
LSYRRKLIAVIGGAVLVGAPIAAAVVLRPGPGVDAPAAPTIEPAPISTGFPAPPSGAVVFSRQLGASALALAVVPDRERRVLLQASVLGPEGKGVAGLHVAFALQGKTTVATPCGPGCYRATAATSGRPSRVELELGGRLAAHWRVALPATWPPPDASALIANASNVWRSLQSLSFSETLASGPRQSTRSTWRIQRPDRVAYQVKGGWAGVIVGERRWDRAPSGDRWVSSAQTRLTQPRPPWVSVRDAHLLGTAAVQGRRAWRVSFFDPGTPAWFEVMLDRRTKHTLEVRMVATAHFMRSTSSGKPDPAAPQQTSSIDNEIEESQP